VGILGGSAAAMVVKGERRGFGIGLNLALGIVGAIVGGAMFQLFKIFPNLDQISISLRDVLAAIWSHRKQVAAGWGLGHFGRLKQ
jgi:uncharacterized membrane protein YeaQ/YmgE (transglycosylase-associated protein family)